MKPALMIFTALALFAASAFAGDTPVACTMEAKACPDGSYVSRSGPNCEFAPCPGTKKDDDGNNPKKETGEPEKIAPGAPPQNNPDNTTSPDAH